MALGKSSIYDLKGFNDIVKKEISFGYIYKDANYAPLYDCWNTFNYVSNNLKEWAEETVIGETTKTNLIKLSNLLLDVIKETNNLNKDIDDFCVKQTKINNAAEKYQKELNEINTKY